MSHAILDPWKPVANRCKFLLGTASTHGDPRGALVGIALRPPAEGDASPAAMQAAIHSEEFAVELVALLARWGILR